MKKVCSVVCAVALALALSVPALANATPGQATPGQPGQSTPGEVIPTPVPTPIPNPGVPTPAPGVPTPAPGGSTATPGQVVDNMANELLKNPANFDLASKIQGQINADKSINVSATVAKAMRAAINYDATYSASKTGTVSMSAAISAKNSDMKVVAESANIMGSRASVTLHFENAAGTEVQPVLGAIVSVVVEGTTMPANDYVLIAEEGRVIDDVQVSNFNGNTVINFWAPHFSTYAIVPASDLNGSGSGNSSNPIAKTGADMSIALAGSVAVAGMAVVGGVTAAKKAKAE